jgi:hypothetical protein
MRLIFFLVMIGFCAHGQYVTTFDSRSDQRPLRSAFRAIDVGHTNILFGFPLRSAIPPALVDLRYGVAVTVTSTIVHARQQLDLKVAEKAPARAALKTLLGERTRKQAKAEARAALRDAFTAEQRRALLAWLDLQEAIAAADAEADTLGLKQQDE